MKAKSKVLYDQSVETPTGRQWLRVMLVFWTSKKSGAYILTISRIMDGTRSLEERPLDYYWENWRCIREAIRVFDEEYLKNGKLPPIENK